MRCASPSTIAVLPTPALPISAGDRKSTRLNSSHSQISYAVFCLKKKTTNQKITHLTSRHIQPPYTSFKLKKIEIECRLRSYKHTSGSQSIHTDVTGHCQH